MKPISRYIFIAAVLALSIILVLPVSAARLPASTVFQSGVPTPTSPPPPTSTPVPPPTDTPIPPTSTTIPPTHTPVPPTSTSIPPTSTPVPQVTNTPMPTATGTLVPTATSTPLPHTATPIPTYIPPPPPPPIYGILGYHIVRPGETLYCIGRAYKVTPWSIAYVNYIPWPYYVYAGQQLAIPYSPWYYIPPGPVCVPQFGGTVPTMTPTPTPGPGVTPVPPACRFYHYVLPGQTLYGISLYYGVNMYTIAAANNITNLNLIYAYTYLCIP